MDKNDLPKWGKFDAQSISERVQCRLGGVVDRAEHVGHDLDATVFMLVYI